MPMAARINDPTSHGVPLTPGPGSPDVQIGMMPAWRALPAGVGAALESLSNTMDSFMKSPALTPADAAAKLAQAWQGMMELGGKAAAEGQPAVAATAASQLAALNATNTALTSTWTAASAVPGGQPAANQAYTEGIKAAAAAAATATVSALAGLSDMHVCPVPVPIPPHGPGMVCKGSTTVLINNLPAARQNDKVMEACGGADPISMGCPTVDIGDSGGGGGGAGGAAGGGNGAGAGSGGAGGAGGGGTATAGGDSLADSTLGHGTSTTPVADSLAVTPETTFCRGRPLRRQQQSMSCVPAAASMVIQSRRGVYIPEEQLRQESQARGNYSTTNGTTVRDLQPMLQSHGVASGPWTTNPTASQIDSATSGGRPAILALQNPGHAVVVDGVRTARDGRQYLQLRDPLQGTGGCREMEVGGTEWNNRVANPPGGRPSGLLPIR